MLTLDGIEGARVAVPSDTGRLEELHGPCIVLGDTKAKLVHLVKVGAAKGGPVATGLWEELLVERRFDEPMLARRRTQQGRRRCRLRPFESGPPPRLRAVVYWQTLKLPSTAMQVPALQSVFVQQISMHLPVLGLQVSPSLQAGPELMLHDWPRVAVAGGDVKHIMPIDALPQSHCPFVPHWSAPGMHVPWPA